MTASVGETIVQTGVYLSPPCRLLCFLDMGQASEWSALLHREGVVRLSESGNVYPRHYS